MVESGPQTNRNGVENRKLTASYTLRLLHVRTYMHVSMIALTVRQVFNYTNPDR